MGIDSPAIISLEERIELVAKLYKHTLKRSELRDELFAQLSKQTRNNPDRYVMCFQCWFQVHLRDHDFIFLTGVG
jgi:hypothetical protein